MPRIVHFEIQADDPERLAEFYRRALGWKVEKWEGPVEYWLVTTGPDDQRGINGGLMRRRGDDRLVYNTAAVDDLDAAIDKVVAAGGKVVVPKMPIPGVGWQAYATDPEGTIFGLHQEDSNAG